MKNSGVQWIGEIPDSWTSLKLKYCLSANDGGVWGNDPKYDGRDVMVLRSTEQTIDGKWQIDEPAMRDLSPVGNISFYMCRKGDLLVTKSSGSKLHIGKTTLVDEQVESLNCCYSNFLQRLHVNSLVIDEYIWYLLNSNVTRLQFAYRQNATSGIGNINATDIDNILIPLPSLPEQKAIVNFLDLKCGKIDCLRHDIDQEIKVLQDYKKAVIAEATTKGLNPDVELKQSGIDWIESIPAHWQVVPFRSYVVERTEKNFEGRNQDLLALSFALGVTRYADKKYNMDRVKEDFSGYQIVHQKDLVLSPNDIIKGSVFVSEYDGCISPMYKVFSNYDPRTYNLYYLSYHLRTKESGRKFFYIARGLIGEILENGKYVTRRMSVSRQDLLKFKVLLPPIEEQNEIVRYLDEKCAAIDSAIETKIKQLETLDAYKASVVYEYVTGKKQV